MQRPRTASYSCDIPFFNSSTYPQPHMYELAHTSASRASGGMNMMAVCGKALFTSSQLQELERQKMIHKYILASIPVPQQLLTSTQSQCNTPGPDSRFPSSGSDPEPWRCKRTDGKKWRCSRDVAPDQKYCERHAKKNRPRSRKHVEISPHSFPHKSSNTRSTTSFDQTRCIEWLMREDNPLSSSKQQWDQQLSKNDCNVSVYHPQFADKQDFTSCLNPTEQTTRLFIDAWGKDGVDGISSTSTTAKGRGGLSAAAATEKKFWPSSSLSLSRSSDLGIGMMMSSSSSSNSSSDGILKNHQWLNQGSLLNSSAPGGPLGEALCLGNANSNHGYNITNSYN